MHRLPQPDTKINPKMQMPTTNFDYYLLDFMSFQIPSNSFSIRQGECNRFFWKWFLEFEKKKRIHSRCLLWVDDKVTWLCFHITQTKKCRRFWILLRCGETMNWGLMKHTSEHIWRMAHVKVCVIRYILQRICFLIRILVASISCDLRHFICWHVITFAFLISSHSICASHSAKMRRVLTHILSDRNAFVQQSVVHSSIWHLGRCTLNQCRV